MHQVCLAEICVHDNCSCPLHFKNRIQSGIECLGSTSSDQCGVHAEFMGFEQQLQPSWLARDSERIWRGSYKNKAWKHLVRHSSMMHMHLTCSISNGCSSVATAALVCVKGAVDPAPAEFKLEMHVWPRQHACICANLCSTVCVT